MGSCWAAPLLVLGWYILLASPLTARAVRCGAVRSWAVGRVQARFEHDKYDFIMNQCFALNLGGILPREVVGGVAD